MSTHNVNLNLRIPGTLRDATRKCAKQINESQAVFVRKAIVNRLNDEGIWGFTEVDAVPWPHEELEDED